MKLFLCRGGGGLSTRKGGILRLNLSRFVSWRLERTSAARSTPKLFGHAQSCCDIMERRPSAGMRAVGYPAFRSAEGVTRRDGCNHNRFLRLTWYNMGRHGPVQQGARRSHSGCCNFTEILGARDLRTITAIGKLAVDQNHLGLYQDAENTGAQAFKLRKEVLGRKHPDTIMATANLAGTWDKLERYTDAEKAEIEVLDLRKEVLV